MKKKIVQYGAVFTLLLIGGLVLLSGFSKLFGIPIGPRLKPTPVPTLPPIQGTLIPAEPFTLPEGWGFSLDYKPTPYWGIVRTQSDWEAVFSHVVDAWQEQKQSRPGFHDEVPKAPKLDFQNRELFWVYPYAKPACCVVMQRAEETATTRKIFLELQQSDFMWNRVYFWWLAQTNKPTEVIETVTHDGGV